MNRGAVLETTMPTTLFARSARTRLRAHLQNHFIWFHGNVGDIGVRHKAEQVECEVGRPPERQEGAVAVANEPLVLGTARTTHPFHHLSRQLQEGVRVNYTPPSPFKLRENSVCTKHGNALSLEQTQQRIYTFMGGAKGFGSRPRIKPKSM